MSESYDDIVAGAVPQRDFTAPEGYDAIVAQTAQEQDQAAQHTAFKAVASGLSHDHAAAALRTAQETGADPGFVADNLPAVQDAVRQRNAAAHLAQAPAVARYASQSHVHAAAVNDDLPSLTALEAVLSGFPLTAPIAGSIEVGRGALQGLVDVGAALVAGKQALVGVDPETEQALAESDYQASLPMPGDNTVAGKAVHEIGRSLPMLGIVGSAEAVGAGLGGDLGRHVAGGAALFALGIGPLFRRLRAQMDENGDPLLTDEQARNYALTGAAVAAGLQETTGSWFIKGLPGVSEAIAKVGEDTVLRAIAGRTTGRLLLQRAAEAGGHVASGAVMMASQGAVNSATEQLAKQLNGGRVDWSAVGREAVQGLESGLVLAPLAVYAPVRDFLNDLGRIRDARFDALRMQEAIRYSNEARLTRTAPAEAEQLAGDMAQRGDMPSPGVPIDRWDEYWKGQKVDPQEVATRLLGDSGRAYADAKARGGDLIIPAEKFLVQLGPQGHAARLLQDVRLSEDGLTPREAAERAPALDPKAAVDAVPPEQRAEAQKALDAGAPKQRPEPLSAAGMRELATASAESRPLGEMTPGRYGEAARRAGERLSDLATEAAGKAQASGEALAPTSPLAAEKSAVTDEQRANAINAAVDVQGRAARAEKTGAKMADLTRQRDLNRAMEKAAAAAQKEAEQHRKFLQGFTQDDKRAQLGLAGQGYLDQVDRLLSGFELGPSASRKEVAGRQATMAWIAGEQAAGRDPAIPESVLSKLDRFVHWKELTLPDLRDLRDSVENVAHLAELKNTLLSEQGRRDRAQVKQELTDALFANVREQKVNNQRNLPTTVGESIGNQASRVKAALVKVEELVREMDGGQIDGPWSKHLWNPLSDAYLRWLDLRREAAVPIKEMVSQLTGEQKRDLKETRFTVDGQEYTLEAALSVALNSGNESNQGKMIAGWSDPRIQRYGLTPWGPDTHDAFLQQLDQRPWMWDFVQKAWDTLESLRAPSFDLERRMTGLEPKAVEASGFTRTLADGSTKELRGGYYPVAYDPRVSRQAAFAEAGREMPTLSSLFDPAYNRAATPQGHLIERIEGFSRPVDLTIDALSRHVNDATKDIAMREALLSAHDLLTDSDMRAAMLRTIGEPQMKAMQSWVRDLANELVVPDGGERAILQALNATRRGVMQAKYAFNIASAVRNLSNFANASVAVPQKYLWKNFLDYVKSPNDLTDAVNTRSAEMRNRLLVFERDLSESLRDMQGETGALAKVREWGMLPIEMADKVVAYPAWLGAFEHAGTPAEKGGLGLDEATAIRHADRVVRLNVYAASTRDLPAIMRSPVGKMVTLNYKFANLVLNQAFAAVSDARSQNPALRQQAALRVGHAMLWTAVVGTLSYELLAGRAPEDDQGNASLDPADVAKWGAEAALSTPFSWVPIAREFGSELETGRESDFLPIGAGIHSTARTVRGLWKVGSDWVENGWQPTSDDLAKLGGNLAAGVGNFVGAPVSQGRATLGYIDAVNSGDERLGADAPLGLLWGKKRKGSLREITAE